jgi:hypothetical protein
MASPRNGWPLNPEERGNRLRRRPGGDQPSKLGDVDLSGRTGWIGFFVHSLFPFDP